MNDYKDRSPERYSPGLKSYARAVYWLFGKLPFGYSHDLVMESGAEYLERRIIWCGWFTLRYHVFLKGDQDRHMHDHPWWFITFPLDDYYEYVDPAFLKRNAFRGFKPGMARTKQLVRKWRFHFRPATYRHIVLDPPEGKPVRTLVIAGGRSRSWGFWVDGEFVYYREYE